MTINNSRIVQNAKVMMLKGAKGDHGVSPTFSEVAIDNGYRVTITDADGEHTIDLTNGISGNYLQLINRPTINGHTITGDKTGESYELVDASKIVVLNYTLAVSAGAVGSRTIDASSLATSGISNIDQWDIISLMYGINESAGFMYIAGDTVYNGKAYPHVIVDNSDHSLTVYIYNGSSVSHTYKFRITLFNWYGW